MVESVDSGSRVLVEASSADLFGNYTVRAVSPQGVVYEEWTLVAAYGTRTLVHSILWSFLGICAVNESVLDCNV